MNIKVIVLSLLFLGIMGLYIMGEGVIFIEGSRIKFGAIILISITIYYYIGTSFFANKCCK